MRSPRNKSYGVYLGDVDRRRTDSQGILSYSLALSRALAAHLASDERLVIFCSVLAREELGELPSAGRVDVVDVPAARTAHACLYQEQVAVYPLLGGEELGVVHFPKGRIPIFSRRSPKYVATVHDDIPMQYWAGAFGQRRSLKTGYVVASLKRTLRSADLVLTDSEFSRQRLERVATSRTPIRVVFPGLGLETKSVTPVRGRAPRFLVFDSPHAHKRSDEAIAFAIRFLLERRLLDYEVLLVGDGRGAALRELYRDRVVHERGPVSTERVGELVGTSGAVIVSSRYEGLGLPALEAWAAATPAVVADSGAAREVLEGVPGIYRQGDYASFASTLDELLALDPAECEVCAKTIKGRFDWGRAASQTLELYRDLAR